MGPLATARSARGRARQEAGAARDPRNAVDRVLHLVARRACQVAGVSTCSAYLRDRDGVFRGRAIHNPVRADALNWLRRSQAGIDADEFTREIVESRLPVLITDAQHDPRPVRAAMREWGIRSMLGVPMIADDEVVGVLFLDNRGEPRSYTVDDKLKLLALANLGAIAVGFAQRAEAAESSARGLARRNRALERARAVEDELTRCVLEGGGIADIARRAADMTGKPCAVLDGELEPLAVGHAPGGLSAWSAGMRSPRLVAAAESLGPSMHTLVEPQPAAGLYRRLLLVRGPQGGGDCFVVLAEHGGTLNAFDTLVAEHATALVALQLATARRTPGAGAQPPARAVADPEGLGRWAEAQGVDAESPHLVCLVRWRSADSGAATLLAELQTALDEAAPCGAPPCLAYGDGVAVLLPWLADTGAQAPSAPPWLVAALEQLAAAGRVAAAVSGVSRSGGDCARAVAECERMLRWSAKRGGEQPLQVVDRVSLGPAGLLLSCCDPDAMGAYARELLGDLDDGSRARSRQLETLRLFFERGRSIRAVAAALGVHENTVRYRLAKVRQATGLDVVADPTGQLAAQLALLAQEASGAS